MEDRETPRMRKYGESKTTRIMVTTVPHVTSGSGLRKFQADGFLLDRVYLGWLCTVPYWRPKKFTRHGDLAPEICAPVMMMIIIIVVLVVTTECHLNGVVGSYEFLTPRDLSPFLVIMDVPLTGQLAYSCVFVHLGGFDF